MRVGGGQEPDCQQRLQALCIYATPSYNGGESLKAVPMPPAFIVITRCACLEAFSFGMFYTNIGISVGHRDAVWLLPHFCKEGVSVVAYK